MKYDHSHKGYLSFCNLSIIDLTRRNGMRVLDSHSTQERFQTKKINWNKDYFAPTIFEKEHVQQYSRMKLPCPIFICIYKLRTFFGVHFRETASSQNI